MSKPAPSFVARPLIVFDLDGTLVDSLPGIVDCLSETLDARNIPHNDEDLRKLIGTPLIDVFKHFSLDDINARQAVADYRAIYVHRGPAGSTVYKGVPEMLTELRNTGRTLALATSKLEVAGEEMLEAHNLRHFFTTVVGATEDGTRRHKNQLITEVLSRTNFTTDQAVMVGDRHMDIEGADELGVLSIGATWGYAVGSELWDAGASGLADSPLSLTALLQS